MPFTFSHPLAVVPLRRYCPERFNFAALVVGSLAPDFGYYAHGFGVATVAHSMLGAFFVCVPTGLIALAIFYRLRRSLCYLLPNPHRAALMPIASVRFDWSVRSLVVAALSVLLGAATHSVWDSFTHSAGWAAQQFDWLRATPLAVGQTSLPVSYVLQQLSTFGAGGILVFLYWRWARRQRIQTEPNSKGDRWRYLVLFGMAIASIAAAAPVAFQMASHYKGYLAFRVFVFRCGVYSVAAFVMLFVIAAVVLRRRFSRSAPCALE